MLEKNPYGFLADCRYPEGIELNWLSSEAACLKFGGRFEQEHEDPNRG